MKLAGTIEHSFVNGTGIRFVIFFQGCSHHCKGCQNPDTWSFSGGYEKPVDELVAEIKAAKLIDGVTFSGGDPLCQPEEMMELANRLKADGYNIWLYTGYTYEEIPKEYLKDIDVVVDGEFLEDQRDDSLAYRGSKNQRIIDLHNR